MIKKLGKKRLSRLHKNLPVLKALHKAPKKLQRSIVGNANKDLIYCLSDISHNIKDGNFKLTNSQRNSAKKYKNFIRYLATKKSINNKKRAILQKGGFLSFLIGPALALVTTLISELTRKK